MSEKAHFSRRVLSAAEKAQKILGQTGLGRAITSAVAGSDYPIYRQLDWQTPNYPPRTPDLKTTVTVQGDRNAGPVPRFWHMAMVMAFSTDEFEELERDNFKSPQKQAAAYIAEDTLHVGTKISRGYLFERLNKDEMAIAMRLGKGPLEATVGLWLPDEKTFESVSQLRVVEEAIPTGALVSEYPGIVLV